MRFTASVAAASVGPVLPADTSASARPSPTAAAAWTIEASRFERTAATASSPALMVSGASTTSACGPAASARSRPPGPNRRTGSPERATPSATAAGPWSAPFASTAITRRLCRPRAAARRPRGRRRCRSSGTRDAAGAARGSAGSAGGPASSILCCERRLLVRAWDCLCLGTAMRAGRIACLRGPCPASVGHVRLRDRRRRLGRLRAGQPPHRGPGRLASCCSRPAVRTRTTSSTCRPRSPRSTAPRRTGTTRRSTSRSRTTAASTSRAGRCWAAPPRSTR